VKAGLRHISKTGRNLNKIVSINLFFKSLSIIRSHCAIRKTAVLSDASRLRWITPGSTSFIFLISSLKFISLITKDCEVQSHKNFVKGYFNADTEQVQLHKPSLCISCSVCGSHLRRRPHPDCTVRHVHTGTLSPNDRTNLDRNGLWKPRHSLATTMLLT
jgi:hypothetical protein